jgi:carbon-monoxide dehydrogenase large subunit
MSMSPAGTGIGQPVRRREDLRLLSGRGRYSDDTNVPGQAYAVMLRSAHAHARIRSVDVAAAMAAAGVLAVLTGRDMLADGLQPIPHAVRTGNPVDIQLENTDGSPPFIPPHYPLATDEVRHVGDIVAMVVAVSLGTAKDAAELVVVDYAELPPIVHSRRAMAEGAPRARRTRHPTSASTRR